MLSEDSAKAGINWYIYCYSNPIRYTDSTGLNALLDEWIEENYAGKITVTIAAARPIANSRQAIDNGGLYSGHSFIVLYFGEGEPIYRGFYPPSEGLSGKQLLFVENVISVINNDKDREWNIAKTYIINEEQAKNILSFIGNYDREYNMASNNCTTWAVDVLEAGSINAPTKEHKWLLPDNAKQKIVDRIPWYVFGKKEKAQNMIDKLSGYSPADAVQDIKLVEGRYVINIGGVCTEYFNTDYQGMD
jgi:hypothetical protein